MQVCTSAAHTLARVVAAVVVAGVALVHAGAANDPIGQVDHISIGVADPEPLFLWLTTQLGLPETWPLASFGPVRTGGVSVGNVNIEVLQRPARQTAVFQGVAFEPGPLEASVSALNERGIPTDAVERSPLFQLPDGEPVQWNSVRLPQLSAPETWTILCEYKTPAAATTRATMTAALQARSGGPLGILGADALVIGTGGDTAYQAAWTRLTQTGDDDPRVWNPGAGPRITLASAEPRGLRRLVLRVRALEAASRALERDGALATVSAQELQIAPARAFGLDIRLVAAP